MTCAVCPSDTTKFDNGGFSYCVGSINAGISPTAAGQNSVGAATNICTGGYNINIEGVATDVCGACASGYVLNSATNICEAASGNSICVALDMESLTAAAFTGILTVDGSVDTADCATDCAAVANKVVDEATGTCVFEPGWD